MTRHETIIAGRGTRRSTVRVERRRSQAEVRGIGVRIVGDALFRLGGALSGADVGRILAERRAKVLPADAQKCRQAACAGVEKRDMSIFPTASEVAKTDIGCQPREATKAENQADLSTSGLLADDVCRMIRPATGTFGRDLWGGA